MSENRPKLSANQVPTSTASPRMGFPYWPGTDASQANFSNLNSYPQPFFMPVPLFNPYYPYYFTPQQSMGPMPPAPPMAPMAPLAPVPPLAPIPPPAGIPPSAAIPPPAPMAPPPPIRSTPPSTTSYQLKPQQSFGKSEDVFKEKTRQINDEPMVTRTLGSFRESLEFYGNSVVVYTHGTSKHSGRLDSCAGIGIYWADNHRFNRSLQLYGFEQTARRAEIKAVVLAIKNAMYNGYKRILICTDNYFVVQCATQFLPQWQSNDWYDSDGQLVQNKDLFQYLNSVMMGMQMVEFCYIHNSPGLDQARKLAQLATNFN